MTASKTEKYRYEIDGLRAIAVLAVLLYHLDADLLPGGFIGVDVFFVISGYLISSIILRDLASGKFTFRHFFARRAKRLLPAASVMVAVVFLVACACFLPTDLKDLGESIVAYSTMVSNVLFSKRSDYFAGQTRHWPLLHTWSLAVEEQFYLAYPCLLFAMRTWPQHLQRGVLLAMVALSFVINLYQTPSDPNLAYFLLPARAWELAVGAVCVFHAGHGGLPRFGDRFAAVGFVAICWAGIYVTELTPFPGWAAVLPVAGTAILLKATQEDADRFRSALSWQPLTVIGKMSYSLYLWHWPMLVFARYAWSAELAPMPTFVTYCVGFASFPVAWLSYRYIESPARHSRLADNRVLAFAAVGCACAFACGLAAYSTRGLPFRFPPTVAQFDAGQLDINPRRSETLYLPTSALASSPLPRIGVTNPSQPVVFCLLGDSHADSLVTACDRLAQQVGAAGVVLSRNGEIPVPHSGISVSKTMDPLFASVAFERIAKDRIPVVIVAARWTSYLQYDYFADGALVADVDKKAQCIRRAFLAGASLLRGAGVQEIWIVRQIPDQRFHVPRKLAFSALLGREPPQSVSRDDFGLAVRVIDRLFTDDLPDWIHVVDLGETFFAAAGGRLVTGEGRPMYHDDNHLTDHGAMACSAALKPIFAGLARYAARPAVP